MDEIIHFRDFVLRNKDCLLKGKNNIRKVYNSYLLTKRANIEEYRRKLRLKLENRSKDIYKRKRKWATPHKLEDVTLNQTMSKASQTPLLMNRLE